MKTDAQAFFTIAVTARVIMTKDNTLSAVAAVEDGGRPRSRHSISMKMVVREVVEQEEERRIRPG